MRGFVPTPDRLVDHMVELLFEGRNVRHGDRILDPGCGAGAFIKGVVRWSLASRSELAEVTGVELDGQLAAEAASHFRNNQQISVIEGDFLKARHWGTYDYVIGNPPYASILELNEREKAEHKAHYRTATGRFDLYMLFFERALEILEPGGRLVFVTPEKYTYVDSAASLRALLSAHDVRMIEFLPEDTFGSLVTYPLVTVLEKAKSKRATRIVNRRGLEKIAYLPPGGMSWQPFVNGSGTDSKSGRTADILSAVCDRVSCGVATGADKVFVRERNELPEGLNEFAWPTVSGRDLDMAKGRIETHAIMLVPYGLDGTLTPLENLGGFARYLMEPRVSAKLLKRTCTSRKPWYAFHETPCMPQILRPKILCKDIACRPAFWLDRSGATMPRHSTYYIVPRNPSMLEPLCEYLNSKHAREWLTENCQRAANGFIRTQSNVLKRLPIPSGFVTDMLDPPQPMLNARRPGSMAPILEFVA